MRGVYTSSSRRRGGDENCAYCITNEIFFHFDDRSRSLKRSLERERMDKFILENDLNISPMYANLRIM